MRFSTVATLCAAPLALASSLQADLAARGAVAQEVGGPKGKANSGSNVVVQEVSGVQLSSSEVIVIWVNNGGGAATSTVTETKTVIGSSTIAPAGIATHTVMVGGSGLVYQPEQVKANVGDMVIFTFMNKNHTATQSAFGTPCEKLTGGMDSGFMPNPNNSMVPPPQMAMQVAVATPIWFYCRQAGHCGQGMTFSINPQNGSNGNKTQAAFKSLAIMQNGTGTTPVIAGGAPAPVSVSTATASAAIAPPAAGSGSMVSGTGTMQNGACACSCLCGTAAFPAAVQGIGAFGGMSGAMPMSALEVPS